jgi:hypothetical protein
MAAQIYFILFIYLFIFCSTGIWTQGLVQMIYCLSHATSPTFFVVFETGSPYVAQAGLNSQLSCLSILSAEITGMHHHTQLNIFYWYE